MSVEASVRSLSLRDVLEARDAYHVHLLRLPHVVATAVGRYLKRHDEDGAAPAQESVDERLALPPGERPPRTLENSSVQSWSWPVVLAFVDYWMSSDEIARWPDDMVPRRLFLPDGRVVPTCVVYAPPVERDASELEQHLSFPSDLIGGGYVCLSDVQGRERVGSIGCLVTDGDRVFALTNRHVAGTEPGRPMYTMVDAKRTLIGHSAEKSATRLRLVDAYPGFAGERTEVAIDAGLVAVADQMQWTTQVFGLGVLDLMHDISPESLKLELVGKPVHAFGAASGALTGEIAALFYRYATVAGVEYVADALVGPRSDEPLATRPGDSGTLWVLDHGHTRGKTAHRVEPLAMQWGGHVMVTDGVRKESPYALVTFISNVCRALDVEIVTDWNTGHDRYWGEVGHYTIGARACDLVAPKKLRDFFVANRTAISFDLEAIKKNEYKTPDGTHFYPLADVPDRVWKRHVIPTAFRGHEGPNHFADMDEDDGHGTTLMSMYDADPATLNPTDWVAFYSDKLHETPSHMGLLPFRVAQLYRVVVEALGSGAPEALEQALCAAGVMAHYVGDACQPLHVSRLHHGETEADADVHEDYETRMVGSHRRDIINGLSARLRNVAPMPVVTGHREAGRAVADLMQRTIGRLPPEEVLTTWRTTEGHVDPMWDALKKPTMDCMADGCKTLAMLWSSAWKEAGAAPPAATLVDLDVVHGLYADASFAPSLYLTELKSSGIW
jgi:hypothetical protein